jgi:CRISPR/Cas system CMR-associated protein Cmr5 small subunit
MKRGIYTMYEYNIWFNGLTWTCEILNSKNEVEDSITGNTPIEALKNALNLMGSVLSETGGLTKEKKEILRKSMGSASSDKIDLNKIRDEYKERT